MARQIRTYFLLPTFLYLIACDAAGAGCGDETKIFDAGGGDDDTTPTIVLEMYRCGAQFRAVRSTPETGLIVIGEGGIAMAQASVSGRIFTIYTGVANDLNDLDSDDDSFYLFGEGLTPDEPGIIRHRSLYLANWLSSTHPARGGFTDYYIDALVTTKGEVLLRESDGWKLLFEEPGGQSFYGVARTGDYITAVGVAGAIYRNENPGDYSSWVDESIENGPDFRDIFLEGDPQDVLLHKAYAVGGREIWRRSDGTWERVYNNANGDLYAIERYINHDDFWVAGTNGTILHYNGSTWQQTHVGKDVPFRGITRLGEYACGDDGAIYNRSGSSNWIDLGYTNISPWNDIDGLSADDIFAANGDTLMRWNGDEWRPFANAGNELISVAAISTDRIWVITRSADGFDNFVNVWTGNMFQLSHHSSMDPFNSIWCDNTGDTVLVAANNGYVFRKGGAAWEWTTADPTRRHFYDVDGPNAHDAFAVGQGGMIAHFDGASWKEMASGVTETLRAISGPVAVGDNGAVTRYNGSEWRAENSGTPANLNAVYYIEGKEAWAVGDGGVIIRSESGGSWVVYERDLYTVDLKSVWGADPDDIWFGGETGYLLRYQP